MLPSLLGVLGYSSFFENLRLGTNIPIAGGVRLRLLLRLPLLRLRLRLRLLLRREAVRGRASSAGRGGEGSALPWNSKGPRLDFSFILLVYLWCLLDFVGLFSVLLCLLCSSQVSPSVLLGLDLCRPFSRSRPPASRRTTSHHGGVFGRSWACFGAVILG